MRGHRTCSVSARILAPAHPLACVDASTQDAWSAKTHFHGRLVVEQIRQRTGPAHAGGMILPVRGSIRDTVLPLAFATQTYPRPTAMPYEFVP